MKELDLSPYLIDVFIHSQKVADWHNSPEETDRHLQAIETWWTRCTDNAAVLPTGTAYMMLAHLNMLKGYVYALDAGADWQAFNARIFRVQTEIITEFGHGHALWEHGGPEGWDEDGGNAAG